VLAELKSADPSRQAELAQRLAVTPPTANQNERTQVAQALEPLLQERQREPRVAACKALGEWGTRDSVPPLIGMLSEHDGNVRGAAIAALARLKDERAIKPIAARLKDVWDRQRGNVAGALEEFGPRAEDAMIPLLNGDHFTQLEAIKVLKAVGTQKSIPALEEAAAGRDVFVQRAATDALQMIRARQGQ
jgi:HEAT repeat protein